MNTSTLSPKDSGKKPGHYRTIKEIEDGKVTKTIHEEISPQNPQQEIIRLRAIKHANNDGRPLLSSETFENRLHYWESVLAQEIILYPIPGFGQQILVRDQQ